MNYFNPNTLEKVSWWMKWGIFCLAVLSTQYVSVCYGMKEDFKVFNVAYDWVSALKICKDNGYAGLAILDTQEKMKTVFNMDGFISYQDYWVGLQQRDRKDPKATTFKWDFAMASSWVGWAAGMPNLAADAFCGVILSKSDGISNTLCSNGHYVICEETYEVKLMTTTTTGKATEPTLQTTRIREVKGTMVMTSLTTSLIPSPSETTMVSPTQPPGSVVRGTFPIIHKDENFQNSYPDLVIFSGMTRSDIECVTVCAKEPTCAYTVFVKSNLQCATYSSAVREESYKLVAETGTTIRERHTASGQGGDSGVVALPSTLPVLKSPGALDKDEMAMPVVI